MGLLDKEWFREESRKRAGLPPNSGDRDGFGTKRLSRNRRPTTPENLAKANNVSPTHAVLAAHDELAIRARAKKTFAPRFICGAASVATTPTIYFI